MPAEVAEVFKSYAPAARRTLKALRTLLYETAAATDGVGEVQETLKWGEPAYLTPKTKSGTTIRLGWKKDHPDTCFLFVHCQTSLIETFRAWFPELRYEGNRAIALTVTDPLPTAQLTQCIEAALTYHQK